MKNLIITIGIIIFAAILLAYQSDFNNMAREKELLKSIADEAVASSALCIDEFKYGEGYLVFDDEKVIAKIEEMLKLNLDKEIDFEYTVLISDESVKRRKHGDLEVEFELEKEPYVLLKVDIGKPKFRIISPNTTIYAISAYEYLPYN
ncbi:MAG: hypothetical protein JJE03_01840 [Peptostreptococcaceae bacterium]|nr:hypothetical protein [Peptostreptococcaceae bacterium]